MGKLIIFQKLTLWIPDIWASKWSHEYVLYCSKINSVKIVESKSKLKTGFETRSNLSLGTRLTRVKRLSRKRCCDTTPDRCQEGSRLTILLRPSGIFLLICSLAPKFLGSGTRALGSGIPNWDPGSRISYSRIVLFILLSIDRTLCCDNKPFWHIEF